MLSAIGWACVAEGHAFTALSAEITVAKSPPLPVDLFGLPFEFLSPFVPRARVSNLHIGVFLTAAERVSIATGRRKRYLLAR